MKNRVIAVIAALVVASGALATETTTYEYDSKGRLIKSTKSGGPASGTEKCTSYDPAGNRTNQTVNSAGCGAGSGGGGGGGGPNNPPVAANDSLLSSCGVGSKNVVANDSDPDGDPITVTAVTGGMGAYITGGTSVGVTSGYTGTLTYTLTDSNGATDTATISVFDMCGPMF